MSNAQKKIKNCLTVGELREMLENYDDDMPIITWEWDSRREELLQTRFLGDVGTTNVRLNPDGKLVDESMGGGAVHSTVEAVHLR